MKKVIIKISTIILIIFLLNIIFTNICRAEESAATYAVTTIDVLVDLIFSGIGAIVAIFTIPQRLVATIAGWLINAFTSLIAYVDGATTGNEAEIITPFDIFFNKIKIIDINFFDLLDDGSITSQIRTSVAEWYYIIRAISIAVLLIVLMYVGIRMALTTIASDRAMYKKMLIDWVASLALIFVLQYIMIFIINVNNAIVGAIETTISSGSMSDPYNTLTTMAVNSILSLSITSLATVIIYCMLVWQTLGLLFSYFNRMLKLAFLTIISPLISLTYSIDKMGDGKAQALSVWLKEYVFTILMQPFHCIIYMCFIDTALNLLKSSTGLEGAIDGTGKLVASIVAILCVNFIKDAEKLVRKIFHFENDDSQTNLVAGMAAASATLKRAKNFGSSARKTVNGVKNFAKNVSPSLKDGMAGILAATKYKNSKNDDGSSKSYEERKEEALNDMDNKKAEKIENKNKKYTSKKLKKLGLKGKDNTQKAEKLANKAEKNNESETKKEEKNKELEAKKAQIANANPTLSGDRIDAMARLEVAKDNTRGRRTIKNVKGYVDKKISSSGTLSALRNIAREAISEGMSGGIGLMVAAGGYGTGINIIEAATWGEAAAKGVEGFMSESKNNIVSTTKGYLKNISSVKDKESAQEEIDNIYANREDYDLESSDGKNRLNELLKEIVEAAGLDEEDINIKQQINTTVRKATGSPREVPEILNGFANQMHSQGTDSGHIDEAKFGDAKQNLSDFGNRVGIAYQIKVSENVGVPINEISEKLIGEEFGDGETTLVTNSIVEESILDLENLELPDTDKELKDLYNRINKEIKKLERLASRKSSNSNEDNGEDLKELADKLKIHKALVVSSGLMQIDGKDFSRQGIKLARRCQSELDEAIQELENNSNNRNDQILQKLNTMKNNMDSKFGEKN